MGEDEKGIIKVMGDLRMLQKLRKFPEWAREHPKGAGVLLAILVVAAFLRLWRIGAYMTFRGDEGRDATVLYRLLAHGDIVLVGPGTSIGNMYLGPLYYYLVAPFYWLFGLSPVGPAVMVAVLGVMTVGLVWWVGREWFGGIAGVVAAGLYAISPVVITYSRSSWNPNIMPLAALLTIYGMWRVWRWREWKWLVAVGVAFAFVLQSHYLGLLLLPTLGLYWWLSARSVESSRKRGFWRGTAVGVGLFLVLMSPLVVFDGRHGWRNFGAIEKFFVVRQETVNVKPWKAVPKIWPLIVQEDTRLVAGKDEAWGKWVAMVGTIATVVFAVKTKRKRALGMLLVWYLVGMGGLGLYKQHIYDHYFGFIFPAPFLFGGWIFEETRRIGKWGKWVTVGGLLGLALLAIKENPLRYPPNYQYLRASEMAEKVVEEAGGEPFNFGLIAQRNYEAGYTYFFERWGAAWRGIDPQRLGETLTEQLFVVCEDEVCEPVGHPKAEIANFGWGKIDETWEFDWGVKLFRLVHVR